MEPKLITLTPTEKPPARVNGKTNRFYSRWWAAHNKDKVDAAKKRYRATEKGRAATYRWHHSPKGIAAAKRQAIARSYTETPDEYADRILKSMPKDTIMI